MTARWPPVRRSSPDGSDRPRFHLSNTADAGRVYRSLVDLFVPDHDLVSRYTLLDARNHPIMVPTGTALATFGRRQHVSVVKRR
jgi:hypothetical protein